MKKKVLVVILAIATVSCLVGCKVDLRKDQASAPIAESVVKEVSTSDSNFSEAEPEIEEIEFEEYDEIPGESAEIEEAEEAENGFSISFGQDFEEVEVDEDLDDSTFIRCLIDGGRVSENYIDVRFQDEYTANDLFDAFVLQSGTDNVFTDEVTFGNQGLNAMYCSYNITDDFQIAFYVIPHGEGSYVIEVGSHIYNDEEEELGIKVGAAMEDVINGINFKI